MERTLLGLGIACIIASIVGGGFKGLGVEIPAIRTARRQVMLAAMGVVLIASEQFARWKELHPAADASALVQSALDSYDAGDFGPAARQLRQAAEVGNAEAQYHYGEMLYHGEGLIPNKTEAAKWILKSAQQGFPPAEASAAMLALQQTAPDTAQARVWAERSANQNDPVGLHMLAELESDSTKRLNLLRRAAERGYAPSQLILGLVALRDARDAKRAIGIFDGVDWTQRAAKQGDQTAQLLMARYALDFARTDTSTAAPAYVWWLLAQQPHNSAFVAQPDILAATSTLGRLIEARLSIETQIEARRQATDEPGWQPKLERPYRHGH